MTQQYTDPSHPTREFLCGIDIHTLLPQREPFVMVGQLVAYHAQHTVTETTIKPDNLMVDEGCLCTEGIIENIAQTCATRIGYINKYILRHGIQIGYIGAVRHFKVHRRPKVGERICTTVHIEQEVFGMTLAKATVHCGGELLAETEIKIAVKDEEE